MKTTTKASKTAGAAINVVKLVRGRDSVTFAVAEGDSWCQMANSHGEAKALPVTEARERIAALLGLGWRAAAAF